MKAKSIVGKPHPKTMLRIIFVPPSMIPWMKAHCFLQIGRIIVEKLIMVWGITKEFSQQDSHLAPMRCWGVQEFWFFNKLQLSRISLNRTRGWSNYWRRKKKHSKNWGLRFCGKKVSWLGFKTVTTSNNNFGSEWLKNCHKWIKSKRS